MNVPLDHIAIQLYGPRNQLLGHVRIPGAVLSAEFQLMLIDAQAVQPAYTPASLMRWIVLRGVEGVRRALASGGRSIPVPHRE